MRREFVPFDADIITKEFDDLPAKDADKFAALLVHYQTTGLGNPAPAQVDDYGNGLYRLRHIKSAYQGRLIFFAVDRVEGFERLVILTVYKKQSQKVPDSVLETAKRRKKQWEEGRNSDDLD